MARENAATSNRTNDPTTAPSNRGGCGASFFGGLAGAMLGAACSPPQGDGIMPPALFCGFDGLLVGAFLGWALFSRPRTDSEKTAIKHWLWSSASSFAISIVASLVMVSVATDLDKEGLTLMLRTSPIAALVSSLLAGFRFRSSPNTTTTDPFVAVIKLLILLLAGVPSATIFGITVSHLSGLWLLHWTMVIVTALAATSAAGAWIGQRLFRSNTADKE